MKTYTITLFALLITATMACAKANDDWTVAKKQASLAIDAGHYPKAWK